MCYLKDDYLEVIVQYSELGHSEMCLLLECVCGALCICAGQRGVLNVMQVFIKVSSYVRCAQDGYLDYSDLGIWFMPRKRKCLRNCY